MNGIPVFDENGNRLGESKMAARSAIFQVVVSRILMATPGMSKFVLYLQMKKVGVNDIALISKESFRLLFLY